MDSIKDYAMEERRKRGEFKRSGFGEEELGVLGRLAQPQAPGDVKGQVCEI